MIGKRNLTIAGVAVGAAMLAFTPGPARADEDMSTRRQACRLEARVHIKPKGQQGREFYDVIVERRRSYIAQCMVKGPQQPQSTASILPPLKPTDLIAASGATTRPSPAGRDRSAMSVPRR